MANNPYLKWMADNTPTQWCNDSAILSDLQSALEDGAVGCTTNPPLSFETLSTRPGDFEKEYKKLDESAKCNDRAVEMIGVVVRTIGSILKDKGPWKDEQFGYVRAQVQPALGRDKDAMLEMGKKLRSFGDNVMVKIPCTTAGIWTLEELAALGIPTTPTVCLTVSQFIAVGEAHDRGRARAEKAGIKPAPSTAALVMGRLQDYLTALNEIRGTGLSFYDLECAALAVTKRCYQENVKRGFNQKLMPAAFRSPRQVEQMVGSDVVMTIHPKVQKALLEAEGKGEIKRGNFIDDPVDQAALDRVAKALPEFTLALEPGAIPVGEFDFHGGTVMTLQGFDLTGWQKLLTL